MKTTPIGQTGLTVTPLSFGTSSLGNMPDTYGYAVDEAQARETLRAMFAGPVNLMDSSRNYGLGRSEALIGQVLAEMGGLPEGYVLSTKLDRDMETGRFDADRARRSLEESLEALGLDRVHILHLHDPEHARDIDEIRRAGGAMDVLFRMKEEGLANAVGLAMGRLDVMEPLLSDWSFDVLINHNRWTLLNRSADRMFTAAHEAGVAIINAAPFAGGALAKGASYGRVTYQETDAEGMAPVRALEELCARHEVELGAVALQFSMRDPRIASTLVGTARVAGVARNLAWAEAVLPDALWEELEAMPYSAEDPEAHRVYKPG